MSRFTGSVTGMDRCAKCSTKLRDGGHPSPLGERVCGSCATTINGAAVGLMSGGGLGGALAGPGILGWVQRTLRPRSRKPEQADDGDQPVVPDP